MLRNALFALSLSVMALSAQTPLTPCGAPPAVLQSTQPNIFSEEQEQWLGDAMADMLERDNRPVRDPALNAYAQEILQRLLKVLPPSKIQFRVQIIDAGEVNGFSLAGGRVYLTRKLIASARSEDEVASVMAHELGHILSHQFAVETTHDLRVMLGVTQVTTRADIYAKFQQLVDARIKKRQSGGGDTDEKQDEADRVAVYATAAAGYRPQAYTEFWDRSFFVQGKMGNALSDFFGVTKPESKRLRAISRLVAALPPGCGSAQSPVRLEFAAWQAKVTANQAGETITSEKPLSEIALTPPLRMDLERIRFSHDAKYLLAQDESSIFVVGLNPNQVLFRFDADRGMPANFTPDSQRIVFHTPELHVEEWSVSRKVMVASHELVSRHDCVETWLSPDGRTIVCLSLPPTSSTMDLMLLNVDDGAVVYEKKDFFTPSFFYLLMLIVNGSSGTRANLISASFSPDGNTLLIGPGWSKLAFDLRTRTVIPIGSGLKNKITGTFAFQGNNKVVGINAENPKESGIFSFPDGKQLLKTPVGMNDVEPVTDGDLIVVRNSQVSSALVDIAASKVLLAGRTEALDAANGIAAVEGLNGDIVVLPAKETNSKGEKISLPLSPLGRTRVVKLSKDGRYLALSARTRGGVWDLQTGKRLIYVRGFTGAAFGNDGTLYGDFPKLDQVERAIVKIKPEQHNTTAVSYKVAETSRLVGDSLIEWKDNGKHGKELIAHDVADNSVLWNRVFSDGVPGQDHNSISGQSIFSFPLKSGYAKEHVKSDATLTTMSSKVGDKNRGRLIQLVNDADGKILREVAVELPTSWDGQMDIVGDNLYLSGEDNRTFVYSLSTGAQIRQMFGYVVGADAETKRVMLVNRRDETTVYEENGAQTKELRLGSPVRFARFQEHGTKVLVLTADQKVRTMVVSQ